MATIRLLKDFKEFLKLLNDHGVEYLIVGAYAVNYHGYVRTTGDLDVWVGISQENSKKMVDVLRAFGFSNQNAREDIFMDEKKIIQWMRKNYSDGYPALED